MMVSISRAGPAYYAKVMAAQKAAPPPVPKPEPVAIPVFKLTPKEEPPAPRTPRVHPFRKRAAFPMLPLTCKRCGVSFNKARVDDVRQFCSTACRTPTLQRIERVCEGEGCNKAFLVMENHLKRGRGRFCSHNCASKVKVQTMRALGRPPKPLLIHLAFYRKEGGEFVLGASGCGIEGDSVKAHTDDPLKVTCKRCKRMAAAVANKRVFDAERI